MAVALLLLPSSFWLLCPLLPLTRANPDSGKAGSTEQAPSSALAGGWRLVRSHNPNGGADAISIMHSADTTRSDLDLAGIMIRCSESGAEVVIVTLPALPFRVRPHVAFGKPGNAIKFEATVAPPGTVGSPAEGSDRFGGWPVASLGRSFCPG